MKKNIFCRTLKSFICLAAALANVTMSIPAHADIAVRSAETSETEFQALAQALGHTPVSDFITGGDSGLVSAEMAELFRSRLIEAQASWLKRESLETPAAVDRFLELASEGDWGTNERLAFETFYVRKLEMKPTDAVSRQKLRAFTRGEAPRETMSPSLTKIWSETKAADLAAWSTFRSSLPVDIVGVLVNGRYQARQEFGAFRFAHVTTRVTLLSNVYQPMTLVLAPEQSDWPTLQRQMWIAADCAIARPQGGDPKFRDVKMKILGLERCQTPMKTAKIDPIDRETIEKFGLTDKSGADPFPMPHEETKSVLQKTWFWGVVGALAIGAAVVIASQRSTSPQPVHNDGW